jgi:hypothetical protein
VEEIKVKCCNPENYKGNKTWNKYEDHKKNDGGDEFNYDIL